MPVYKYTAKNIQGQLTRGKKEAENQEALAASLRQDGYFLTHAGRLEDSEKKPYRPNANELADFAQQIGTMLSSGITLIRALSIILQGEGKPALKKLYQNVYTSLQRGLSFSDSLQAQQGAFPPLMISMIRAGEASGKMDAAAKKIAAHYRKDHKMRSKIKSAMIYPIILICVAILVFLGIFIFILPSFFDTFEDLGVQMPGVTRVMLAISNALIQDWAVCLFVGIGIVFIITCLLRLDSVRLWLDKIKLKLPKVGSLLRTIYTARFARTLSTLYTSGLSIIQSLTVAADTIGNRYISRQFHKVVSQVRSGAPLSAALKEVNGFAPKLFSVTAIGEEAGRLDEMLDNMAESFDFESEKAIDRLIAMAEPAMIILLAIGIGIIMVSVLLPLFTMYQNLGR